MKKRISALLLAALLGLTACGAPAETGAPTGEIFIYGEEHANAACLDKELALWQTCYGQGMRHMFIEMGAGSTLLLNRWMAAEDDAYWDMVYGACEGTLFHAEVVAELVVQFGNTDCQAEEVERIVRSVQNGVDGRGWTVNFYPSRENVGLAEILITS